MSRSPFAQLTSLQRILLDIVQQYPGQFSRSGLAKMLVGAKSWQDRDFPEYGRLAQYHRKDILYQVDILLQQHYLQLDSHNCLTFVSSGGA